MRQLTATQYAKLTKARRALGLTPVPKSYVNELLMFWTFDQIVEYLTRQQPSKRLSKRKQK